MSKRVLRPAFLLTVTLGAGACDKPASNGRTEEPVSTVIANPPPLDPPPEARPDAEVQPVTEMKKRTVRNPIPEWTKPKTTSPYSGTVINPAIEGRRVRPASDGSCYVVMPPPPNVPLPPGAEGPRKTVSCPDEMLEPAWDTCIGGDLSVLADGECVCLRSGNPPPPPTAAECPSSAKKPGG